jgi:hypothetical protein
MLWEAEHAAMLCPTANAPDIECGGRTMQVSEKSEELYDELAKQIEANDDAAARGIFQELLNNGFSR